MLNLKEICTELLMGFQCLRAGTHQADINEVDPPRSRRFKSCLSGPKSSARKELSIPSGGGLMYCFVYVFS